MNFDNYEFRCSALGKIMSAKDELTQSNKTYLQELFIGEVYGVRKEITTKYFEKGNLTEQDGLTLLQKTLYPKNLLLKNTERKHNGFIHGETDCIPPDGIVYDIKNAWDLFTFGKAYLTTDYEWQLRGYMWLWNKKNARLFYCINNMPESLLVDEEKKIFYQNHFISYEDKEYQAMCEEMRAKHNYDKMELWERFKVWNVSHSEEMIEKLKGRIKKCRHYLNELWTEHQDHLLENRALMSPTAMIAEYDAEMNATIINEINLSKLQKI